MRGSVTADKIIIAVDKLESSISPLSDEVFHAQTFLSMTEPLTDRELRILFPCGEQMQCWDSKLVYTYFRLTADNRLLLGGGTPITTYLKDAFNNPRVIRKIIEEFLEHFPELSKLSFMQFWPGQIDATRDLLPTIAEPPGQPHIRFIFGAVGIPWAAFTGSFTARNILGVADEDYQKYFNYFSNERKFFLPSGLGKVIGKPLLFSLTNSWAKFFQVDKLREAGRTGEGILRPAFTKWFGAAAVLLACCLAAGCTVGPDYERPEIEAPEKYRFAVVEANDLANTQWWQQFHDPTLDELIQIALSDNFDVRIAAARVDEFYGNLGVTRSGKFPQIGAEAAVGSGRTPPDRRRGQRSRRCVRVLGNRPVRAAAPAHRSEPRGSAGQRRRPALRGAHARFDGGLDVHHAARRRCAARHREAHPGQPRKGAEDLRSALPARRHLGIRAVAVTFGIRRHEVDDPAARTGAGADRKRAGIAARTQSGAHQRAARRSRRSGCRAYRPACPRRSSSAGRTSSRPNSTSSPRMHASAPRRRCTTPAFR